MKIVIGSDHAGFEYRDELSNYLEKLGYQVLLIHFPVSEDGIDYPDVAKQLVHNILTDENLLGILICGTGIGMSISANRFQGIRAALCTTELHARLAREHNHSNVLCLGSRIIGLELAKAIVSEFINTQNSSGSRHFRRINKIDDTEL